MFSTGGVLVHSKSVKIKELSLSWFTEPSLSKFVPEQININISRLRVQVK